MFRPDGAPETAIYGRYFHSAEVSDRKPQPVLSLLPPGSPANTCLHHPLPGLSLS